MERLIPLRGGGFTRATWRDSQTAVSRSGGLLIGSTGAVRPGFYTAEPVKPAARWYEVQRRDYGAVLNNFIPPEVKNKFPGLVKRMEDWRFYKQQLAAFDAWHQNPQAGSGGTQPYFYANARGAFDARCKAPVEPTLEEKLAFDEAVRAYGAAQRSAT